MSVSRVINNHPSVKLSRRAKVMQAIAKIGYSPNDAVRILKGRMRRTIALVVPDLSDFFSSCFHGRPGSCKTSRLSDPGGCYREERSNRRPAT